MQKEHSVIQIIYLDTKQKDIYNQRPILQANELLYDSTNHGKPIYISSNVLKNIEYENEIPLIYGHRNKHLKLGNLDNFKYDVGNKVLLCDIHVLPRWNEWVLRKFAEGVNGLSTEFRSFEKNEKYFDKVISIVLERVAIVPFPASHNARVF